MLRSRCGDFSTLEVFGTGSINRFPGLLAGARI